MTPTDRFSFTFSSARRAAALGAVALLLAGCVGAAASPAVPGGSASPDGSTSQSGSPVSGFYLRASQTQALAPQYTFGSLPGATIADGVFIDGMVAVPMIYPGPVYVGLSARPISAEGIDAIVAEARADGLLNGKSDFSEGALPGGILGHVELIVDGATYELTGSLPGGPAAVATAPGTPGAFQAFWNRMSTIGTWLAADLGQSAPYSPKSVAIMLTPPAEAPAGFTPVEVPWPLPGSLATFGTAMSVTPYRCGTVSGADLATLLPVVQASNQLARFTDSTGASVSFQARVLVPGEPGPCA